MQIIVYVCTKKELKQSIIKRTLIWKKRSPLARHNNRTIQIDRKVQCTRRNTETKGIISLPI